MRYFLEYKENKVIGWLVKNTNPIYGGLTEVEPHQFKSELKKIGVDFILENEKIEKLQEENLIQTKNLVDSDFRLSNIELGGE